MKWFFASLTSVIAVGITQAQQPAPLKLVRCAAGTDAPCLRARFEMPLALRGVVDIDSGSEARAWNAALGGAPLVAPGLVRMRPASAPAQILVLVDRGASMAGEGMAFTRAALRSWLGSLGPAAKVAVAGFESRDVRSQIENASFGSPAQAAEIVDNLPAPARGARSAIYSAAALGAVRLAAESGSAAGPGRIVLMITAGRNDVVRGTDADLLAGAADLASAARAIAVSGQRIILVELSETDTATDMHTLVGRQGTVVATPRNPNALAARLATISRGLVPGRELTFGVNGAAPPAFARVALNGTATLDVGHGRLVVEPLVWRPPLIAMPVFRGVADSGSLSPAVREALLIGANTGSNRPLILVLIALVVASFWMLVPRLGWQEPVEAERVRPERGSGTSTGLSDAAAAASPRKPEDITQQTARRTAMHR